MRIRGHVASVEVSIDTDKALQFLRDLLEEDDQGIDLMSLLTHFALTSEMRSRMEAAAKEETTGETSPQGGTDATAGGESAASRPAGGKRRGRRPRADSPSSAESAETPTEE